MADIGDLRLDPRLGFRPFPPGDPIPEIWSMIREIGDPDVVRRSAAIVLDAHIAIAKLQRQAEGKRIDALTQLRETIGGKG